MMNSITFLGTGTSQGVPMIGCDCEVCRSSDSRDRRLRTSAYIEYEGLKLVIDAGPDFRYQALRANLRSLDGVLLTHKHKDHTGGLDDVRAINYLEKRSFPIYCEQETLDSLRNEYSYAFAENRYPGAPDFEIHLIDENPFEINGVRIVPIRAMHYRLPVLGFRFGDLAYLTDVNQIDDSQIEKIKGVKVFVISTVRMKPHMSHFSLPQAVEVCGRVGAQRCFLTHISHQLPVYSRLVEIDELRGTNVTPAYDNLRVEF